MSEEFDEFDDLADEQDDDLETIVIVDDEGNQVELVVLDFKEVNDVVYLLVVEESLLEDEEAEASILRGIMANGDEMIYEFIEDDKEFEMAAALFQDSNDDFEIEM